MTSFTPNIKRVGTNAQDQFKLGIDLAKEGKIQEAILAFKTAVQAEPEFVPAHMAAGNLLFKKRQYKEALSHFEAAMKLDPLMPMAPLKAASTYLRENKLDEALEYFSNAIDLDPHSSAATFAYVGLGQVYFKKDNYEAAIESFRKALRLNPQMMIARLMSATVYKKDGKLAEAIAELKVALNINHKLPISYVQIGSIYLEQQNYTEAKKAFEAAVSLNPKGIDIKFAAKMGLAATLIEINDLQTAADILRELPETKQYAAKKHKLFGDLYSRQGLPKEAAEEYRAAILLGSPDGTVPTDLDDLEDLDFQDERWEELVESYRSSAIAVLQAPGDE